MLTIATKESSYSRPISGSFSRHASSSRPHSGSVSLSATNTNHRVNRRKSVNAQASSTAAAAIAAALKERGDASALPYANHRKSTSRKATESQSMMAKPSMHTYFTTPDQEAVEDNSMDEDMLSEEKKMSTKERNRRASEGSHLTKGKKSGGDLRCETCGKGYKHSSCLTKHLYVLKES